MKKKQRQLWIISILFSISILVAPLSQATELSQPITDYFNGLSQFNQQPSTPSFPLWQQTPVQPPKNNSSAKILQWVPSNDTLCRGYYKEPAIVLNYPHPQSAKQEETTITADLPSLFSQSGTSVLQGNVTVTQPGRQITADKALLNRNGKTGKITDIDLIGNVHIREAGKLIVAEKVHIDLHKNTAYIEHAIYRFSKKVDTEVLNAWGTLEEGIRESSSILDLKKATYTTCPPTSNTWRLIADHLHLDKEKGRGTAYNSWLTIENIPVFYTPYFTFPLDDRRKSGFLFPTYGYSSVSGMTFSLPYYFNLASNYDATYTPTLMTERGVQQNLNFRYLTTMSNGSFNISVLPDDSAFKQFKQDAPGQFSNIPDENLYLTRLNNSSNTRGYFSYVDQTIFDPHWSTSANLNYVTDDYYLQDFGTTPGVVSADQLLNEGDLKYQGENWNFLGRLQGYETLHPINETVVEDQYARLPEFDLNADYPNQAYGLDYQLKSQFVYFDHPTDFFTGNPIVTGDRYHFDPGISWPMANMSGYFTPQLQLDSTYYDLKNQASGLTHDISRVLPIFDIDSGLFFDRTVHFFHKNYRQTLEPRVFYLYVPNKQQGDIPLFDTTLPPFSFEQMFQTNRFTGIDRIGDANQITGALTTRFLTDDGQEKMRASIGSIFLFQQHQVSCDNQLQGNCLPDPTRGENISPLVAELSYNLNPVWNITSDIAWDPNSTRTDNGSFNLVYNYGKRLFNVGYYFVRNADVENEFFPINTNNSTLLNSEDNVNRLNLGFSMPLTERWSALADWNYNFGTQHSQLYFYGAQYESCCWAMRFLISRNLMAVDQLGRAQFNTAFYIQFQLKGLANFGYNNPSSLLTSALPGYRDDFQNGFRPLMPTIG